MLSYEQQVQLETQQIEKLAASVAELRQIQTQKALRLRRAVVFWLTGLALVLWGWIG